MSIILENELQEAVLGKVRSSLNDYLNAVCAALPLKVPQQFKASVSCLACGEAAETVERLRKIIDEYCCDDELTALPEDQTDWKEVMVRINGRLPELYVGRPKMEV
jgi:hypothetical protein